MSWRMVTLWEWICDRCGAEHAIGDSEQLPEDWTSTDDRDLCGRCSS